MKMPKADDAAKDHLRRLAATVPGAEVKPMFGQLGAFLGGNMFAALWGADIGVKLADDDLASLRAAGGGPFGPEGRPMNGYASLPAGMDDARAERWIGKAAQLAASLPPKATKR